MDVLTRNGIEVGRLAAEATVTDLHSHAGVHLPSRTFPAGTLTVDLAQPRGRMARALLERDSAQDESFLERQERKRVRNETRGENATKDDYDFYDFTAWSLPLAFGVEAYWTSDVGAAASLVKGAWTAERPAPPARATSAYVFSPESESGYRLAFSLLADGFRVAAATRTLRAAQRTWPRGTFVVRVERNAAALHERIAVLSRETGTAVVAVNTAFNDEGTTGIGSGSVVALKRPQLLLVTGEPTRPASYGSLRSLIEDVYGFDVVPVSITALADLPLSDFHAVILPDGSPSGYRKQIGEDGVARLKTWIEAGGTLVAIGDAARFVIDADAGLTTASVVGEETEGGSKQAERQASAAPAASPSEAPSPGSNTSTSRPSPTATEAAAVSTSDRAEPAPVGAVEAGEGKPQRPLAIPGAILRAEVDRFHFLTFGVERDTLPLLVEGDLFLHPSTSGTNVLRFPEAADEPLRLAGFTWKDNTEPLIRGTAAVIEEPVGAGRVVLMTHEPGVRLLWHASTQVLMNALLYGPALGHAATGE